MGDDMTINIIKGKDYDEAIKLFQQHCEYIIQDEKERHIFLNFLGFIIARPDKRVNWAVLLQGDEGNGKSFFEVMMREILGGNNMKSVSNTVVKTDFNDWAYGSRFNVLSELKIAGESRYNIYNNIKAYVTDEEYGLNRKGLGYRLIPNTASYMITTNYKDSAPITDKDRRLFVIFTNNDKKSDAYYDKLFSICKANPYSIKQYLTEYPTHSEFNPYGKAIKTEHHKLMSSFNTDAIEIVINEAINFV